MIQIDVTAALLLDSTRSVPHWPQNIREAAVSRKIAGTLPAVLVLCYQQRFLANPEVRSRCGGDVLVWTSGPKIACVSRKF